MKHVPTELPVKTDDLLDLAECQGWKVERTSKNHYKLTSPDGHIVGHSGTPSDHRAVLNFRAELKRKGLLPYVAPPEKSTPVVVEQKVESTPPEVMETTVAETKQKAKASPGAMQALITKILREHDKPVGLTVQEVWEFARVAMPKVEQKLVGGALNYARTKNTVGKIGYRNWRLSEFIDNKHKNEDADDVAALEKALEALATIEKVVRKTIAQRKKLQEMRDIMAKMG